MRRKWRKSQDPSAENSTPALLDYSFGDLMPAPADEQPDAANTWQNWLDAVDDQEFVVEFEPTKPSPLE